MGLCVALFAILQYFSVRLPINVLGGTISLAMVPIIVLALLRGPWVAFMCGVLCGLVDLAIEPFIFHPVQLLLDYPLAFGLVGLAGVFASYICNLFEQKKATAGLIMVSVAAIFGISLRFISHVISGIVFFKSTFPDDVNELVYSVVYNGSYIVPSMIATIAACMLIMPVLFKVMGAETLGFEPVKHDIP